MFFSRKCNRATLVCFAIDEFLQGQKLGYIIGKLIEQYRNNHITKRDAIKVKVISQSVLFKTCLV